MSVLLSPDILIARIAERQHGLITLAQAREAGLSQSQITHRCRTGRWLRITKGVYVVAGVPPSWRRDILAACLASPPGTAAAFPSAAALHDVWTPPLLPQVMVPPGASARSTIAQVRRGVLDRRDVMTVDGIPCMTPARTLVDAAEVLARDPLAELVDDVLCRRLASAEFTLKVAARAQRAPGRRGTLLLREVLDAWSSTIKPGSPAEVRALRMLEQWGFGRAVKQYEVRRSDGSVIGRVDLAFPEFLDGAEYDSVRWHNPRRWGRDEARYAELEAAGWHIKPIDKHDLMPGEHAWRDSFAAARARRRAA